jgi:hypothetical protein
MTPAVNDLSSFSCGCRPIPVCSLDFLSSIRNADVNIKNMKLLGSGTMNIDWSEEQCHQMNCTQLQLVTTSAGIAATCNLQSQEKG